MVIKARHSAKLRGLEFTITADDIVIPEKCPVLGIPLENSSLRNFPGLPSLDRMDNSKGYVPGNVRVISYRANFLKNNATLDELLRIVEYVRGER